MAGGNPNPEQWSNNVATTNDAFPEEMRRQHQRPQTARDDSDTGTAVGLAYAGAVSSHDDSSSGNDSGGSK